MNAQQLFVVAITVFAVGVCGRQLNFFENPGFGESVFSNFLSNAAPSVYGSENPGAIAVGVAEDFAKGAFASLNSYNGTGSLDASSTLSGDNNDTISYVDLSAFNKLTTTGPSDVYFTNIGTGESEFVGGGSLAGFDFAITGSGSSDTGITTGSIVDAFSLAKEGFASTGSNICVGPTCF